MIQLVTFIVFVLSSALLVIILYKKIPALVQLPRNGHHGFKKPKFVSRWEKKLKDTHFKVFKKQVVLHKLLSKAKVWILKMENQIDNRLHGIRKNNQKFQKNPRRKKSVQNMTP